MSTTGVPVSAGEARLALRFHFLFEALRLGLLPSILARRVERLAAAVPEENAGEDISGVRPPSTDTDRRAAEVGAAFLDLSGELALEDLNWPEVPDALTGRLAAAALKRCSGEVEPRAAAERLGRFCEELAHERRGRKATGSYYTRSWAADLIARTMVRGVLEGRGAKPGEAAQLRVLDPAIGAGAFAVAVVEAIAAAAGEGKADNTIRAAAVRECIFGVEVNPLAAEACRLGVWLAASRPGMPAALPSERVLAGDALADRPEWGKFDLVVGNPPWGVKLNAGEAVKLAARAPGALSGHRDSYLFFLHLAAECVRDDGGIGMLLPDTVLSQVRYEGMRRALLERFRPLRVVLLGERIFPGATAPTCALCLVGKGIAPGQFPTADLRRVKRSELADADAAGGWLAESDAPLHAVHSSFLVAPGWLRKLLARMEKKHSRLGKLGDLFKFHDVGINYPRAEIGREILYAGEREDVRDIAVVRGRDFRALTRIGHSAWLRHDWRERVGSQAAVREQVYRRTPKLLLRQTGDRPVATVDRGGVFFGRSVIAVTARSECDLLWLAAVLNSGVFAALYRAMAPEAGRPFAQVKVSKLKVVPIPRPSAGEALAELARTALSEDNGGRRALLERIDDATARAYGLSASERMLVAQAVSGGGDARSRRGRRAGT